MVKFPSALKQCRRAVNIFSLLSPRLLLPVNYDPGQGTNCSRNREGIFIDNTIVVIEYRPLFFPQDIEPRRYDFMYIINDRSRPIIYTHTESEAQSPISYIVSLCTRCVT